MNRKYTTSPAVARAAKARQLLVVISLCIYANAFSFYSSRLTASFFAKRTADVHFSPRPFLLLLPFVFVVVVVSWCPLFCRAFSSPARRRRAARHRPIAMT